MQDPLFGADDLARQLDSMTLEARDELAFGLVLLDREGKVRFYNRTEARQSGFGERRTVGREFFRSIAPCMDTEEIRGRITRALADGTFDLELGHTGDFEDPTRLLRVRAMSAAAGGTWLAILR